MLATKCGLWGDDVEENDAVKGGKFNEVRFATLDDIVHCDVVVDDVERFGTDCAVVSAFDTGRFSWTYLSLIQLQHKNIFCMANNF